MVSHRRLNRLAHFAHLQGIGGIFKFLECLSGLYPRQFAAILGSSGVLRVFLGQFCKVGTFLQHLIKRVCLDACSFQFGIVLILFDMQQDMRGFDQSTVADAFQSLVIYLLSLSLDGLFFHERWSYLLVAVHLEFFLERFQRVHFGIISRSHLQLVIDE